MPEINPVSSLVQNSDIAKAGSSTNNVDTTSVFSVLLSGLTANSVASIADFSGSDNSKNSLYDTSYMTGITALMGTGSVLGTGEMSSADNSTTMMLLLLLMSQDSGSSGSSDSSMLLNLLAGNLTAQAE